MNRMVFAFAAWACGVLVIGGAAVAANGDIDPGFGAAGLGLTGLTDALGNGAYGPVVQTDGKILIADTRTMNGASGSDFFVARFTANGALDSSFSFDGRVTIDFDGGAGSDVCLGIALQADGKVVVVGSTSTGSGNDFAIARLNGDGTLDTTFGGGTGKVVVPFDLVAMGNDIANAVTIQANGKILVVGSVQTASNGTDFGILRLNGDGTPDPAFNLTGKVSYGFDLAGSFSKDDTPQAVAIDTAGRIVVSGSADKSTTSTVANDFAVLRLQPNGQLDPNFDADGRATVAFDLGASADDQSFALLLQHDGHIVLAGAGDVSPVSGTSNYDMAIVRLLPDGSPDATFGIAGKTLVPFDVSANGTDNALGAIEQANGKIILTGYALQNPGLLGAAARLNPDGSPDSGFGSFGKKTYDFGLSSPSSQLLRGVALQGSRIVAAGGAIVDVANTLIDDFVVRLEDDLIFADGFD